MFFDKIASFLPVDIIVTFAVCVLASLSVAIVMRFIVKTAFLRLNAYIKEKHPSDKVSAIYNTIKSIAYLLIAGALVAFALGKLMAVCTFPADNNKALAMFYFIPMYALQWFLDAHMKKLACKIFGIEYDGKESSGEAKPEKAPKHKVYTRKLRYTLDDEGNEVPVEE